MKKIILSGYMGCGKSTIARLLHARTGIKMIDLDDFIEKKTGKTIAAIFASDGEIRFRKLEHEALKEILAQPGNLILSLGGGTPCYANNHELLKKEDLQWIYLKATPDTIYQRVKSGPDGYREGKRPLLTGKTPEEIMAFIGQHLFERSHFYNMAGYKFTTDGKSPREIVEEIEKALA